MLKVAHALNKQRLPTFRRDGKGLPKFSNGL